MIQGVKQRAGTHLFCKIDNNMKRKIFSLFVVVVASSALLLSLYVLHVKIYKPTIVKACEKIIISKLKSPSSYKASDVIFGILPDGTMPFIIIHYDSENSFWGTVRSQMAFLMQRTETLENNSKKNRSQLPNVYIESDIGSNIFDISSIYGVIIGKETVIEHYNSEIAFLIKEANIFILDESFIERFIPAGIGRILSIEDIGNNMQKINLDKESMYYKEFTLFDKIKFEITKILRKYIL